MKPRYLLIATVISLLALAACSSAAPSAASPAAPSPTTAPATTAAPAAPPTLAAPTASSAATTAAVEPTAASTTSAASAVNATPAPPSGGAPSGNPSDVILNAEKKFIGQKFRSVMTTTDSADNSTQTITVEFQPPCNVHEVMSTGLEVIVVQNKGTWIKRNGEWAASPQDMSIAICSAFSQAEIDQIAKELNQTPGEFAGPDVIDGQPMFVYQYTTTLKGAGVGGKDVVQQNKLWIGAVDGLPHRLQSTSPSLVKANGTLNSTVNYQYDQTINIQPPA